MFPSVGVVTSVAKPVEWPLKVVELFKDEVCRYEKVEPIALPEDKNKRTLTTVASATVNTVLKILICDFLIRIL